MKDSMRALAAFHVDSVSGALQHAKTSNDMNGCTLGRNHTNVITALVLLQDTLPYDLMR